MASINKEINVEDQKATGENIAASGELQDRSLN